MKSTNKPVSEDARTLRFSGRLLIRAVDNETGEVQERDIKNTIVTAGKKQLLRMMCNHLGNTQYISHLAIGTGGDTYIPNEGITALASESLREQVTSTSIDDANLTSTVSTVFDGLTLTGGGAPVSIDEFGAFFYNGGSIDEMWAVVTFEEINVTASTDITFQYKFSIE